MEVFLGLYDDHNPLWASLLNLIDLLLQIANLPAQTLNLCSELRN